jgi:AraC-like DNA-binding protein
MNTLKAIFLLVSGCQGILLSLALIGSSIKKRNANVFLGFILTLCSIELLNVWAMSLQYHNNTNAFPFWLFGSYLILPCSFWVFLMYNTDPNFRFRRKHLLLFLPALLEMLTEFTAFYLRRNTGLSIPFLKSPVWFAFTELLPVVWMVGVLIQYAFLLRKLSKQANQNLAHLYRQVSFLIVFSVLTVLWIADGILHFQVYAIIESILGMFLFVMGYMVYFQPDFFETTSATKSKSAEELFTAYDDEDSLLRLRNLLDRDKLYLKPRLTVDEVAEKLNLPGRYVSYLINKKLKSNFNTFVNGYRVREVLERLADPKESHKTIVGIALDSGFNSKSSFNQIFKTIKGQTPSEYISKNQK